MASPALLQDYVVPDSVRFLVQKERERIVACMNEGHPEGTYREAVEQYMAFKQQLAELEAFMSTFGISYF